jgi:signal peptidase II
MLNDAPRWFRSTLFMTAATVAIIALLWMFVRGSGGPFFAVSVPLVVSGALGNLVDRIQNGYVVDFIRFHIHDVFEWPTFNLADSVITVGVILLLIDGFRHTGDEESVQDDTV